MCMICFFVQPLLLETKVTKRTYTLHNELLVHTVTLKVQAFVTAQCQYINFWALSGATLWQLV